MSYDRQEPPRRASAARSASTHTLDYQQRRPSTAQRASTGVMASTSSSADTPVPRSPPSRSRQSPRRPTLRSQSPVKDSGPVSPIHRSFASMTLPAMSSFGLAEFFTPLSSPSGSSSPRLAEGTSCGHSPSTGGVLTAEARSDRGYFSKYSPMTLVSSLPVRSLSPPPTYPNFQPADLPSKATSRSRSSTRSSFVSALSRTTDSAKDEDLTDTADEGELADEGSGRQRRRASAVDRGTEGSRRENRASDDTLANPGNKLQKLSVISAAEESQPSKEAVVDKKPVPQRTPSGSGSQATTTAAGNTIVDPDNKRGSAKRKTTLLQRVIKNLQPSSSSGPSPPPSPTHLSPSRASFDSSTSPTSPSPRPYKRTSSFASSFLTSPSRNSHNQRKYVKVHARGLSSKDKHLGKIFLAQTLSTGVDPPSPDVDTLLKPIMTGIPLTEEPLSMAEGSTSSPASTLSSPSPSADAAASKPPRRTFSLSRTSRSASSSRAPSPSPSPPIRVSDTAARPPISVRVDIPSQSSSTSSMRKQSKKDHGKGKPLWCLEWSYDGRYLATAGHDGIIRLYRVRDVDSEPNTSGSNWGSSQPSSEYPMDVLESVPVQTWHGHTDGILTLCWSKNGFLASGSMDKTARLWHPTRPNCLTIFQHPDFCTSIAFHPKDDRFFLSGCCDHKVRIWSIIEKKVRFTAELPEMVTAVAFAVEGMSCCAGTFSGRMHFFTDQLKPTAQLKVRSTRGKNSKGKKITHLQYVSSSASPADERLLVTSNDSRIRLYRPVDCTVEMKLKGLANDSSQIAATYSDDGRWVICGSEDGSCYLWSTDWPRDGNEGSRSVHFEADESLIACASLAPLSTRLLLAAAGDPIYKISRRSNPGSSSIGTSSRPGSPLSDDHHLYPLSPITSITRSIGLRSPMSETSLDLARTLSRRGTLGSVELEALLDTPLIAVATMRGTVKIFRGDPGLPPAPPSSGTAAGSQQLRSPPSREALSTHSRSGSSFTSFLRRRGSSSSVPPSA